ncbi:MAG: hypothetical protein R3F39_11375 [Myxococcota bacterium]
MKRLTQLTLLGLLAFAACELPQNQGGGSDAGQSDADGATVIRSYRYMLIVDKENAKASPVPGPDIDALVFFHDGDFLFAGCAQASLFGQDTLAYPENLHESVDAASLSVREDSMAAGFLSLAGGTLFCELPLSVTTGDTVFVWEVDGDGAERWQASFATKADSEQIPVEVLEGSREFTVP